MDTKPTEALLIKGGNPTEALLIKGGAGGASSYAAAVYGDMNAQVPMSDGEKGPSNNEIAYNAQAAQQYRGGSRKRKNRKSKKSRKSKKTGGKRRRRKTSNKKA